MLRDTLRGRDVEKIKHIFCSMWGCPVFTDAGYVGLPGQDLITFHEKGIQMSVKGH